MSKPKRIKAANGRPRPFKTAQVPTTTNISSPTASPPPPTHTDKDVVEASSDPNNGLNSVRISNLPIRGTPPPPQAAEPVKPMPPNAPFRFLDLPTELRLKVYDLHFEGNNRTIDISPENTKFIHRKMPILRTCRQIYREASHYFYSTHTFRLFPTDPRRFNKSKKPLIARLKPHQRASLTSLELRVGPGWSKPPRSWVVNKRLNLADCVNVRQLCVLVECDPSNSIFNGFRRAEGFYEGFCQRLLDDVLKGLPSVERLQFDAWTSVKKNGNMMQALLETATENHKKIVWGPERGWTDADETEEDDKPVYTPLEKGKLGTEYPTVGQPIEALAPA